MTGNYSLAAGIFLLYLAITVDPKYCRTKADRKADGASSCRNAGQYADRLKIFWYMGTFWISHWNFFFKEAEPEWDGTYF